MKLISLYEKKTNKFGVYRKFAEGIEFTDKQIVINNKGELYQFDNKAQLIDVYKDTQNMAVDVFYHTLNKI